VVQDSVPEVCGKPAKHRFTAAEKQERQHAANARCYARHRKAYRARHKKYRFENPKREILRRARNGARDRGIECTLTVENIPDIPEYCEDIPWIKLVFRVGHGERRDDSPSLDRIDSSLGYIPGNVRIISWLANRIKNNAEDRVLIALGEAAKRRQKV
jgi:hypothetical protein